MKIYTNEIDLARPILKKFYTAPCSDYKFGVKIVQGTNYVIELDGVKLESDGETGGYATYKMTSPNEQGVELFKIICENGQVAYIKHVTTDSTVFDVDEGDGGSVEVPTKTSQLQNDSGFITVEDVPTKTSELVNDSDFATNASVDEKIGGVTSSIPTKTSQLQNDSEFTDKNFVNSSIATNTANFKGTFNNESEFPTEATNNDYLFWNTVDENGNTIYNRYKYIASTSTWTYEYTLNNSSFTAEQWATINGGPYASTTDIPTKVSQLQNDSNFTTKTELDTVNRNLTTTVLNMQNELDTKATTEYVDNAIGNVLTQEVF